MIRPIRLFGLGLAVAATLAGVLPESMLFAAGIVLVLLVADPVTSAATVLGRFAGGALFGALVVLFTVQWTGAAPVQIAQRSE